LKQTLTIRNCEDYLTQRRKDANGIVLRPQIVADYRMLPKWSKIKQASAKIYVYLWTKLSWMDALFLLVSPKVKIAG
jgi:hypothetical protein